LSGIIAGMSCSLRFDVDIISFIVDSIFCQWNLTICDPSLSLTSMLETIDKSRAQAALQ
jgi:hypothetical protein